jgi:NAD(P)-dependent dehydrogenase (short-subunit alcohol dehydrogenase family)
MSNKNYMGKTVFITGGASGIGRSSAFAFANASANVFIIDIDKCRGNSVAIEITSAGGNAIFHAADVTIESDIIHAVEVFIKQLVLSILLIITPESLSVQQRQLAQKKYGIK